MNSARTVVVVLLSIAAGLALAQSAPKKVTRAEALAGVTSKVPPQYPAIARQLKLEGPVELEILVSETGAVEEVTITSGNPVLTKPAADAVRKWKFAPFLQDGKATRAMAPMTVVFKL